MSSYGDRLIRLSDALAAMRKLADSSELKDFGVGYSFLPKVGDALRAVEEAKAVPMDYHDRCMELEIKLRLDAERSAPRWHSVKDKPTEDGISCLVWLDDDCGYDLAKYAGNGKWLMYDGFDITRLVRYWIPRSEPPKNEED